MNFLQKFLKESLETLDIEEEKQVCFLECIEALRLK